MKKINFNLDEDLYKKFKKHCVDIDYTMTDCIIELIKEELKSNE